MKRKPNDVRDWFMEHGLMLALGLAMSVLAVVQINTASRLTRTTERLRELSGETLEITREGKRVVYALTEYAVALEILRVLNEKQNYNIQLLSEAQEKVVELLGEVHQ